MTSRILLIFQRCHTSSHYSIGPLCSTFTESQRCLQSLNGFHRPETGFSSPRRAAAPRLDGHACPFSKRPAHLSPRGPITCPCSRQEICQGHAQTPAKASPMATHYVCMLFVYLNQCQYIIFVFVPHFVAGCTLALHSAGVWK